MYTYPIGLLTCHGSQGSHDSRHIADRPAFWRNQEKQRRQCASHRCGKYVAFPIELAFLPRMSASSISRSATPRTTGSRSIARHSCHVSHIHSLSCSSLSNSLSPYAAWSEVRDNGNSAVDWLIAGYDGTSKTDITVLCKGSGGVAACAAALPDADPVFGGCRLSSGRFQSFYYAPDAASVMKKGRASMHKNGVLNVLEGCDGEFGMNPSLANSSM